MNEFSKEKLNTLANDPFTLKALSDLLNENVEKIKPKVEPLESNSILGERYRAYENAKEILDNILNDLKSYKFYKKNSNNFNKER